MTRQPYTFSAENYERSQGDYAAQWATLDAYLYQLCDENPGHGSRLSVNAKVYIIGRTYQTGIERQIRAKGTQASAISQVIELLCRQHETIDRLFSRLAGVSEPLTASNVPTILEIHGQIVDMLSEITIDGQSPRSFVSKYMHFHNRVVPMYDSIASTKVLPRMVRSVRPQDIEAVVSLESDSEYRLNVCRFRNLYNLVASQNLPVTVRSLDYYLLWEHDRRVSEETGAVLQEARDPQLNEKEAHANG